jgi:hypothetical protein
MTKWSDLDGGYEVAFFVVRHTEVPLEEHVFARRVAHNTFAVPAELWVVRRQKQQARQDPLAKFLDQVAVPEVRVDSPVGGDWAQVDDPYVTTGGAGGLGLLSRHALSICDVCHPAVPTACHSVTSSVPLDSSRKRFAALTTACNDASRMLESMPTPHTTWPADSTSRYATEEAPLPAVRACWL